jgi:hypothetical protein
METEKEFELSYVKIDLKQLLKNYAGKDFIIRFIIFIVLSAIGYGILYLVEDNKYGIFFFGFPFILVESIGCIYIITPIIVYILIPLLINILKIISGLIGIVLWLVKQILVSIDDLLRTYVINKYF